MMKKFLVSCILILTVYTSVHSQEGVKYIMPDSGYQGTSFPITIIGTGTEWFASNYFQIFFDSTGVTGFFSSRINDTTITGIVTIGGKAVTIPRGIYVLDKFSNPYTKDSALKILLTIPVVPTLILPPDTAVNQLQNVTLLWDSNAYATTFRVQLSTDSVFNTIYFDTTVANTPLQMKSNFLLLGTKYFWRVNATNTLGTSGWSEVWSFTVRTVGINQISSEVPSSYKLFNNYPNPFNPVTKIKFQIPKTSYVELKVFDITGKTVATLVNQNIREGIYETVFDASMLSSGVYFVKMQADNYGKIIKTALIK